VNSLKKGSLASLLLVIEQGAIKFVGLISTLILARLILPEDFGIIAIAMLVIGMFEILVNTGSGQYLLRVDKLDDDKINTDWTINFILRTIISSLMFAGAFVAAEYYEDPRLVNLIIALTLVFLSYNLINPGLAYLRREQEYGKQVKLTVITKMFAASATIIAAFTLQNYWALVIGRVAGSVTVIIFSYIIYPYRPRFMLTNAKEQWSFSGWMIPQAIFGYIRTQLDSFLVSSTYGQASLGSYHTIKYIAHIPSDSFLTPITTPFLVELTKAKVDQSYFNKQYNASLLLIILLAAPITSLMYFNHDLVTAVLLGPNWAQYSYLLGVFSLLIPSLAIWHHACRVLLVYGRTREIFIVQCISFFCVFTPLIFVGISDLRLFSYFRVLAELSTSTLFLLVASLIYTGNKNTFKLFLSFIPILLSVYLANMFTSLVGRLDINVFIDLVAICTIFIVAFSISIITLHIVFLRKIDDWQYMESLILRLLDPFIKKIKR